MNWNEFEGSRNTWTETCRWRRRSTSAQVMLVKRHQDDYIAQNRPMVKYVGNMHGDETVGREILLALAEYLVKNYGTVDRVTELLDSTEVIRLEMFTKYSLKGDLIGLSAANNES